MESFGAILKRERERRKISLDEIAGSTKISSRMLAALESDHFDQLPGGIFNRGFVRAYARFLSMDEDQAVADYLAATGDTLGSMTAPRIEPKVEVRSTGKGLETGLEEPPKAARRRPKRGEVPWSVVALALLILALLVALWKARPSHLANFTAPILTKMAPAEPSSEDAPSDPKTSPTAEHLSPMTPSSTPELKNVASVAVSENPPAETIAETGQNSAAPIAKSNVKISLRISAVADCWSTVVVDGKQVFQGVLSRGKARDFNAKTHLVVKAGSVGALRFEQNGEPLPAQGELGEVKVLSFGINGLEVSPAGPSQP